jgi:sugar phosphate isomerase/epimerase
VADAAGLAATLGLDGLEVTAHRPHLDPEAGLDAARAVGRSVRDTGIAVIAYGSYLGRFGQVTRHHAQREAAIAAALQTRLLRVWAEPLHEGQVDSAPAVELMQAACDAAIEDGITVVIERHLGSFADTPERIEHLLTAIGRPNVALNYQMLDFLPPGEAANQPADAARLIRHARYFHLKNYQPNPDGAGPLLPGGSLAEGALDYRAILAAAVAAGYRGPLTIDTRFAGSNGLGIPLARQPASNRCRALQTYRRRGINRVLVHVRSRRDPTSRRDGTSVRSRHNRCEGAGCERRPRFWTFMLCSRRWSNTMPRQPADWDVAAHPRGNQGPRRCGHESRRASLLS